MHTDTVKTETEVVVMLPQVRELLGLPKLEEAREELSLEEPGGQ